MKIRIIAALVLALFLCGCSCNTSGNVDSGSDAFSHTDIVADPTERWAVSADDTEYLSEMKFRVSWAFIVLVELDSRSEEFAEYGSSERLERSSDYRELKDDLKSWCSAALSYPEDSLSSDLAKNVYDKTNIFAEILSDYMDIYSQIAVGEISGEEKKNELVDAATVLYALLWE